MMYIKFLFLSFSTTILTFYILQKLFIKMICIYTYIYAAAYILLYYAKRLSIHSYSSLFPSLSEINLIELTKFYY